ncbi:hypothetical protein LM602_03955 [Candidatus Acetothermia bacterium]|jgi:hypothetical protein|nr:hypothetical protein [Candidatus Acetothermia bacterium]MCI2431696.1 hypothetical protein [Candidatus Acetothermia bacterium]MCI2435671.1 hypothetical protein [Candidatus Acetothermia bacterium]
MHEHELEQLIKETIVQRAQAHQDRIADLEYRVVDALPDRPAALELRPTWPMRLALATAAILLFLGGFWLGGTLSDGPPCADPYVLCLVYPNAKSVSLVGQLTHWERQPMHGPDRHGIWWIRLPRDLEPGRYEYGFMVDEYHWVHDPRAREFVHTFDNKINSVLIWPPSQGDAP